ncbi:MAG: Signal transduction histidine-protein kinase ArlS [Cryomorphaceae bacterium]|nr:MAG: Signal transduction histidine-protein kinase ArlS [Cryomorphaceae bacterium]|tara:strand:- start:1131 stop:2369 length:1239 start_codon:yes stop_codon:yes gene_type:complete
MKLLTKTSLNFISASVIFFLLGSVAMYFSVRNIIAEDLQSRLLQQQKEFFNNADKNKISDLTSKLVFIQITDKKIEYSFSDTVLIVNDSYILYRKLQFSYLLDKQYYNVSILQNQSQSDSLIKKIVIMNVGFAMLFFLIMFFVNRHSIKSALSVFYSTIRKLEDFELSKLQTLSLETAEVQEIKKLNEVFEKMATQIYNDFEAQKEYTENVSHELQTPLAIISSKADELMQADNLSKEQMEQLALLLETTNRLSKINQALIFLTKIDNRFYNQGISFSLNNLIKEKLQLFDAAIQEKDLILDLDLLEITHVYMNPYLAETLIINLIKNAIIHNISGGVLRVHLSDNILIISNSGSPLSFSKNDIFKRFVRSENSKKNLGIGLSIVQRICELYTFKIAYSYFSEHQFKIIFKK